MKLIQHFFSKIEYQCYMCSCYEKEYFQILNTPEAHIYGPIGYKICIHCACDKEKQYLTSVPKEDLPTLMGIDWILPDTANIIIGKRLNDTPFTIT